MVYSQASPKHTQVCDHDLESAYMRHFHMKGVCKERFDSNLCQFGAFFTRSVTALML